MSGGLPLVWLISKSEDCLVLHIEPEKTTPEGQDLARTIQVRHKLISVRFQRTRDTDANRDQTWPFRSNAVVRQWRGGVAFWLALCPLVHHALRAVRTSRESARYH